MTLIRGKLEASHGHWNPLRWMCNPSCDGSPTPSFDIDYVGTLEDLVFPANNFKECSQVIDLLSWFIAIQRKDRTTEAFSRAPVAHHLNMSDVMSCHTRLRCPIRADVERVSQTGLQQTNEQPAGLLGIHFRRINRWAWTIPLDRPKTSPWSQHCRRMKHPCPSSCPPRRP